MTRQLHVSTYISFCTLDLQFKHSNNKLCIPLDFVNKELRLFVISLVVVVVVAVTTPNLKPSKWIILNLRVNNFGFALTIRLINVWSAQSW